MIQGVQGDFDPTSSPFNNRNWTWGMAGIGVDVPRSNNSLIVNNLPKSNVQTESFANNNTPFTSGSNISIQASNGSIFDGVVIWIGPGPRPPTPSTTTTTPGPTTTSSTTTSSTTTSSTTTSSTTTTTTTPPPGYAYSGVDCNGSAVTIYTANPTFSSSDPAFEDNRLTTSFSGYFVYGGITYLYTNGIAVISNCPATTSTTTTSSTTTTPPPPTTTTPPP